MKSTRLALFLALIPVFGACSKKEEAAAPEAAPAADAAAADATATPAAEAAPAAAPAAEAKRDWNAVVAEIARLKMQRPLPEEKRLRMLELQDELTAASSSDAGAREAYQNLSKILNGR
jgi:hypothetical protein